MNILLINGSPAKGNSLKFLESYEQELIRMNVTTQVISLRDFKINQCIGCYNCVTKGKESCPLFADDADKIWQMISAADGIVLAVPVYALGVPASFKQFMDRIAYNAHRPAFYNKPAVLLSTTAGMGTEEVFRQLMWFQIAGLKVVSRLGKMVYPLGQDSPAVAEKIRRQTIKSAKALHGAIAEHKKFKPTLIQVIQFYGLKLNSTFGQNLYQADQAYFAKRKFFTDAKVHPLKNLLGKMVYSIGLKALKRTVDLSGSSS